MVYPDPGRMIYIRQSGICDFNRTKAGLMLAHRLRRWPNTNTALGDICVLYGRVILTLNG